MDQTQSESLYNVPQGSDTSNLSRCVGEPTASIQHNTTNSLIQNYRERIGDLLHQIGLAAASTRGKQGAGTAAVTSGDLEREIFTVGLKRLK